MDFGLVVNRMLPSSDRGVTAEGGTYCQVVRNCLAWMQRI